MTTHFIPCHEKYKLLNFREEATSALAGFHADPLTWSIWNLECFCEGGKPENPEKNSRSKDENKQETQPTNDNGPESNPGHP